MCLTSLADGVPPVQDHVTLDTCPSLCLKLSIGVVTTREGHSHEKQAVHLSQKKLDESFEMLSNSACTT